MLLQLSEREREDAIKSVMTLLIQYAADPGEQVVTMALMFVASDLTNHRRLAGKSNLYENIPRFISKHNPAGYKFSVVCSTAPAPAVSSEPLGFIHSQSLDEATTRFQQAINDSTSVFVTLWDNDRRTKLGEFQRGGDQ